MRDYNEEIKAIQADSGTFAHILAYSGIFRHAQDLLWHIQAYSDTCVTVAYSEPWYIQNQNLRHIKNPRSILQKLLTAIQ